MNELGPFILVHARARQLAERAVHLAQEGMVVSIREPTRNLEQSAKMHALLGDIVKAKVEWDGETRDIEFWKGLAVSGWAIATKAPGEVTKGWEGEIALIRRSTTRMTKRELTSLIDYICAWMDGKGIPRSPK